MESRADLFLEMNVSNRDGIQRQDGGYGHVFHSSRDDNARFQAKLSSPSSFLTTQSTL
jgi:hypothetical protein